MFIPDPDFYPYRISDPRFKNSNKRERCKKIFILFFPGPDPHAAVLYLGNFVF
jgi:hypothetical protein